MTGVPDPTLVVPLRDAAVASVFIKHLRVIMEALNMAAANAEYEVLKVPYREALADIEALKSIAKYDSTVHNEPPEVRHVRSSDSAASGDEIL
jgi:hypothetical protein